MASAEIKLDPPIRAAVDAANKGDAKAFAALFAKDGTVNDWGEVHAGRGDIGRWAREGGIGENTKLRVKSTSRIAGEILVLLEITRDDASEKATWAFRLAGNSVASLDIG